MDVAEVEENVFLISNAKLHGGMCNILSDAYSKLMNLFAAIEAALPRSRLGIQALCSLHIALESAKNIMGHCSECSILYLAVTGESVLLKFERAKCSLIDSLKIVEPIVPQSIGCQILDIVTELEGTEFALDPSDKEVGDDITALLQQGRKIDDNFSDDNEAECFHRAASKLGINSSQAALMEGKALRKLIERARKQEDKQKESIVAYLLSLMNKHSDIFRCGLTITDDNDSRGSSPTDTVQGSAFVHQPSKLSSFNFKASVSFRRGNKKSGLIPIPPEELRCPISLQLMYDPVIVSSGQTYERKCIEKWFRDGHNTCPKTQQELSHLFLTPNYCVKGLIGSWCERHGACVPDGPPESLDLNYWRLALSESESCKTTSHTIIEVESIVDSDDDESETYEKLFSVLNGEETLKTKCIVVEQIRRFLKDDEEARVNMGRQGFVEVLVQFLKSAVCEREEVAQEVGAMALFNIAVNNNRNKELMLSAELVPLLEQMIPQPNSHALVAALTLNLSCLEEAKPMLGSSSKVVPFLINLLLLLQGGAVEDPVSKVDALHAVFNLSTCQSNVHILISLGIVDALHSRLKEPHDHAWIERSIAILINLAGSSAGRDAIISNESLIGELATVMDEGEAVEREQAASCLLILCDGNDKCVEIAVQQGVIPSLVCLSVNGTCRARGKAQKLLMLFREQRKPEPTPPPSVSVVVAEPVKTVVVEAEAEQRPLGKSVSTRMMGRTFSFFRKNRYNSTRK